MICFGRGDVERDRVVLPVGEEGEERRQIDFVGGLVKGSNCCNWPARWVSLESDSSRGAGHKYLHSVGSIPPVKMTGKGNATPASCPSINRRTSRNGPVLYVAPDGKSPKYSFAALKYLRDAKPSQLVTEPLYV